MSTSILTYSIEQLPSGAWRGVLSDPSLVPDYLRETPEFADEWHCRTWMAIVYPKTREVDDAEPLAECDACGKLKAGVTRGIAAGGIETYACPACCGVDD
jgi:hypothetical protein